MPVLTNMTTGTVLAERAEVADALLKRIVGLLGRRSFLDGEAMIFPHCSSIHTCFMVFAIDVIFARQGTVITLIECLHPWRVVWAAGADTAIELPAGALARSATKTGHRLQWTV